MSQVIAGIYEVQDKIGAGGGGIVYLGRHTRLGKQVALKADKRTLSTEIGALRREVDMLKDLSHTYIPQVYDFVQEDGVVYTVMDFIEGESLDKLLGRKQAMGQPQVIKWACQLLEALDYLHSRPPHGILHGDIKPANIMLRPDGDICLIDFNIALALGEEGAVKVGFSRGYASPEHYGADYISSNRSAAVKTVSNIGSRRQADGREKAPAMAGEEGAWTIDAPGRALELGNQGERLDGTLALGSQEAGPDGTLVLEDQEAGSDGTLVLEDQEAGPDGTLVLEDQEAGSDGTLVLEDQEAGADGTLVLEGQEAGPDEMLALGSQEERLDETLAVGNRGEGLDVTLALGSQGEGLGMALAVGSRGGGPDKPLTLGSQGERQANKGGTANGFQASSLATGSSTGGRRAILLDVRSDIYSLGATLYHLLSGRRPAQDAREVEPLGADVCSLAVSAIIQKAMAPEPDMRYQSAEEMLTAFWQLHERDGRVVRHKRRMAISSAMLAVVFLTGGLCAFIGLKQLEQRQTALALAEYSANALAKGDVEDAIGRALQAIPSRGGILEAPVTAQAQKALADALGVYDLSDGFKAIGAIGLPSAPFKLAVSPEGSCFAAVYAYEAAVYEMGSQRMLAALPVQESALSDVVFVDEARIVYAGDQGVTAYDVEARTVLWTGGTATALAVSADHAVVAAVDRDADYAVIYRVSDGAVLAECPFGGQHMAVAANDIFADPQDSIFALDGDGSMLAVSFSNGGLRIFHIGDPEKDVVIYGESGYRHFEGGFYGNCFAFSAGKDGEAEFGLVDTAEAVYLGGYGSKDSILLQADERGIFLANGNLLVSLDPDGLQEAELAYTDSVYITAFSVGEGYALAATDDNCFSFYDSGANLASRESSSENCDFVALAGKYAIVGNRNEPSLRLLELEEHSGAQLLSYDACYRHDEARISQDGQTAMLFGYQGFRVYGMDGGVVAEAELPEAGNIYDQQFVKSGEGSWLEVTWYDGTVRCYSARDGSLVSEEMGEVPAKDLYEEFYTDKYRIASSLHAAPEVYDVESGRLVAALEEDSYLAYVTQMGEYLITEYVSAAGERYGILLDSDFQKLAYLPRLCDVAGDMLVFDYESGDLRQCRLYSLQELVALGEAYGAR